jgi:hypothetical protein
MNGTQSLGQLIEWLMQQPPERVVKFGFGKGHTDRGDYSNACFDPVENTTIREMLKHAKDLLGTVQCGWKGGEYTMHDSVSTHIGESGECGEPITTCNYREWSK